MIIGIDLAPLTYTLTGIGVYVRELLSAASSLEPQIQWHYPVLSELPIDAYFRWRMRKNVSTSLNDRIKIHAKFAFLHDRRRVHERTSLNAGSMELFHVTNAQSQFTDFELPFVITVHDLAWMRLPRSELPVPKIFGLNRLQQLIERANHVILRLRLYADRCSRSCWPGAGECDDSSSRSTIIFQIAGTCDAT